MSSIELSSPVDATMRILRASTIVTESVRPGVRVHGGEVPGGRASSMPEPCIVIVPSGTPVRKPGVRDRNPLTWRRVDVRCYGRSRIEADRIQGAVTYVLKRWQRSVIDRHLVYCYDHTSGPAQFTDPEWGGPVQIVTFEVLLADELVPVA